jgi:leucyl/phenylalanyl-tRNA--protein transferase
MCDNEWLTPTTDRMGFHEMPRTEYLRWLAVLAKEPVRDGRWQVEAGPKAAADWRARETGR